MSETSGEQAANSKAETIDLGPLRIKGVERSKSTIVFAYEDLSSVIKLAQKVHEVFGGECNPDQLAASIGSTTNSGSFRLRVSAGRAFGILGGGGSLVTLTDLGARVLDDNDADGLVEAFLNVELFAKVFEEFQGRNLPAEAGLEARIKALGVAPKQARTARQVLMRSAETAGFFALGGRTRMVRPPKSRVEVKPPIDNGRDINDTSDLRETAASEPAGPAIMSHPLIQGLLAALPDPGEEFPAEDKQTWLKTLEMNLSVIYKTPKPKVVEATMASNPRDPSTAQ